MDDRNLLDIFNALDKYYQKKEAKKCLSVDVTQLI